MTTLSDFGCKLDCPLLNHPWPKHMPKTSCRLISELQQQTNPVTIQSYKDMIKARLSTSICRSLTCKSC